MGLAVVHGIIHRHQGHVLVESEPGIGTSFQLYLPLVVANGMSTELEKQPDEWRELSGHLLAVDDEAVILDFVRELLEMRGCKVTTCTSSSSALNLFEQNPGQFDLVITDQTMPGMTGIDMAAAMHKIRPELPVILCTGFSQEIDAARATELGLSDFLLKPVDMEALLSAVDRALGGQNTQRKVGT